MKEIDYRQHFIRSRQQRQSAVVLLAKALAIIRLQNKGEDMSEVIPKMEKMCCEITGLNPVRIDCFEQGKNWIGTDGGI
jgi:hypothetical protein